MYNSTQPSSSSARLIGAVLNNEVLTNRDLVDDAVLLADAVGFFYLHYQSCNKKLDDLTLWSMSRNENSTSKIGSDSNQFPSLLRQNFMDAVDSFVYPS